MAYEVARVHGLIMSNIQEGEKDPAESWPQSKSMFQMPPPRQSPDTPLLYDFPSDMNQWSESSHSSSLESSTETETESDEEDDLIAGLAEQIAHSMLDDDEPSNGHATEAVDNCSPNASTDVPFLYGRANVVPPKVVSPQSGWSPNSLSASWSDSVSSSKQSSQVSSPPSTPFNSEGDAWALLNAAAGEVVRLKMNEERKPVQKPVKSPESPLPEMKRSARTPQQPNAWRSSPHLVQLSTPSNCNVGSRSAAPPQVSRDRLAAGGAHVQKSFRPRDEDRKACNNVPSQHRLPKNEGVAWNQRRTSNAYKGGTNQKVGRQNYNYGHPRATGKPVDNIGVPQRSGVPGGNVGSGMRAVFLGAAGSGRESGGTGVFLPRCVGGGSENRRKPSCSTVLLPSRIVQVLNLNVEDMRTHPTPLPGAAPHGRNDYSGPVRTPPHMYMMELSGGTKYEGGNVPSFPRKMQYAQVTQSEPVEYSLPTEWTY